MDLEIVGRHALLFDDDAAAEVVNSGGFLVPWSAAGATNLLLDRHDVRHLLDRVPPRPNRTYSVALLSAPSPDGVSEAELDRERFLDLHADDEGGNGSGDAPSSGNATDTGQADYNTVPFSYGGPAGSDDPNDSISFYRPSFPVPESLLNKLVSMPSLTVLSQPVFILLDYFSTSYIFINLLQLIQQQLSKVHMFF